MKQLTTEWIQKADEDFAAAVQLQIPSVVCFHCQQCAEKYLKARLCEAGLEFPKTHDLLNLLKLVLPAEPLWESARSSLHRLNAYATDYRYPGDTATSEEARRAVTHCVSFRLLARQGFGLDDAPAGQQELRVREKPSTYRVRKPMK